MKLVHCKAVVTITIEVDSPTSWVDTAPLNQIFHQAGTETLQRVRRVVVDELNARIIGDPTVVAVMSESLK